MKNKKRLEGKVAIVIGGNGDIGGAIACGLCNEGAIVVPTGRKKTSVKAIVNILAHNGNIWTEPLCTDITREEQLNRLCKKVLKRYGRIDILVNASGVYLNKPAVKVTKKEWNAIIDTNLSGVFSACRIIGAIMLTQKRGSIINIGSIGSFVALSNTAAYSVSKAGLVSLSKSLSAEWASRGVRVNTIIPGVFPTRLNKKALQLKGRKENIIRGIPMKRMGKLHELVGASIFLASDESQYVTGISLPVDGGFLSFSGY